jgi:hypothetical protein
VNAIQVAGDEYKKALAAAGGMAETGWRGKFYTITKHQAIKEKGRWRKRILVIVQLQKILLLSIAQAVLDYISM